MTRPARACARFSPCGPGTAPWTWCAANCAGWRGRNASTGWPNRRPTPLPFELVAGAEAARVVRDAVALLPDSQRQVVELAYYRGLTCREVALAAGIPEGTAKSRLRLALAKLEAMLDRQLLESS